MSVDPQDKWVAAGAAAIPFVVVLVALRLLQLSTAIRLPLALLGVVALLLFGVGLYSLLRRRRQTYTLLLWVLGVAVFMVRSVYRGGPARSPAVAPTSRLVNT